VKSAVEAYTWDELSQISAEIGAAGDEAAAIEVAKKYNLCTPEGKLDGTQVKSVTLADGTQTTVQIVGFAHDDKTSGGKAGITFVFGDAIIEAPMNTTDSNAGGWEASQLRAYLNADGMTLLPEDLQKAVAPVDKPTNNVGETQEVSSVTTTSDSLWLFSFAELAGPIPTTELWGGGYEWAADIFNAEGTRYKLFNDTGVIWNDANSVLVKNFQGSPIIWWERSPYPSISDGFQGVYSDGYPSDGGYADYSGGVVYDGKSITHFGSGIGAAENCCSDFQAVGCDDISFSSVDVVKERDAGRTVGIVLDRFYYCGNSVFVSLKVNDTVFAFVTTTKVTCG
jgi:hypothetical protein